MSEITKDDLIAEMDYLISISRKSKQKSSPIGDHHIPILKAIRKIIKSSEPSKGAVAEV